MKTILQNKRILYGGIMLTVLLLLVGGFLGYQWAGERAFAAGMDAYNVAECQAATEHFDRVLGFYQLANAQNAETAEARIDECGFLIFAQQSLVRGDYSVAISSLDAYLDTYPTSPISQAVIDQAFGAYKSWALQLRGEGEFAQAVEKYATAASMYPSAAEIASIPDETAQTYLEWAAHLRENGEFEEAINKGQFILDNHPDSAAAQNATDEIAKNYLEWGTYLEENGDATQAVEVLETILDKYPDSAAAQQARPVLASAYLGMGEELLDQNKIKDAMQAYQAVQRYTEEEGLLAQAEEGYEEAIGVLAHDTGEEGGQLIEETLELVCKGMPKESPAVNYNTDESGKFLICEDDVPEDFSLSANLKAEYPGHFRYVIKINEKLEDLDDNLYRSRSSGATLTLIRQRVDWEVVIYSVETGKVVQERTFLGEDPPGFPRTWRTTATDVDYLQGEPPNLDTIHVWLRSFD